MFVECAVDSERVSSWAAACSTELSAIEASARDETKQAKLALAVLRDKLDAQAVTISQEREVAKLHAKIAASREAVERLRVECADADAAVEARRAERRAPRALRAQGEATRDLAAFGHLGLDFDGTGEGALQLRFRFLDPTEPDREFTASVVVDGDDSYAAHSVYPPLHPKVLAKLVQDVNTTNNFGHFVIGLRAEFAKLVPRRIAASPSCR